MEAQKFVGQGSPLAGLGHRVDGRRWAGEAPALQFNGSNDAVGRAFARARLWRTPPHWSRRDWLDEVRAIVQSGAAAAVLSYNKERGVPLAAHMYIRALASAWTRYRQEWSYYLHSAVEIHPPCEPVAMPCHEAYDAEAINHFLGQALSQLSVEDQFLIRQVFWNDADQRRVAATLHISQACVSKRKARILRLLYGALISQGHLISNFLTVCWAFLDSLDLLPVIDLL